MGPTIVTILARPTARSGSENVGVSGIQFIRCVWRVRLRLRVIYGADLSLLLSQGESYYRPYLEPVLAAQKVRVQRRIGGRPDRNKLLSHQFFPRPIGSQYDRWVLDGHRSVGPRVAIW